MKGRSFAAYLLLVVGSGIGGLATAVARMGLDVLLVEKSAWLGGAALSGVGKGVDTILGDCRVGKAWADREGIVETDHSGAKVSAGARFRAALAVEQPLQIAGIVNALTALMAQRAGYRALCLSGSAVANVSLGLPDVGVVNMTDVMSDVSRITAVCPIPILVDVDTGFGGTPGIARTTRALIKHGAAAMHIEDQVSLKRCGHLAGKEVVECSEMLDRLHAALDARLDPSFVIVARTDAVAVEGLQAAIDRAYAYAEAGADIVFAEACTELSQYARFVDALGTCPVLANLTEFSMTPNFTLEELRSVGVAAVNYPMSACRAMNAAAVQVYERIRSEGSARSVVGLMQSRQELYDLLGYDPHEMPTNLRR